MSLDDKKKQRIEQIRFDIMSTLDERGLADVSPFTKDQYEVLTAFFDYLIDCVADLEIQLETLEESLRKS